MEQTHHKTNCSARLSGGETSLYLVHDPSGSGYWRWIGADDSDTWVGGTTKAEAINAAEAAWGTGELGIHIEYTP